MRTLQYVAGVVLLALLAVIAYDLHRVANALTPGVSLSAAAADYLHRDNETRAQRVERRAREIDQQSDELLAAMSRASQIHRDESKKPQAPSRH